MSKSADLRPVEATHGRPLFHAVKEAVRAAVDAGQFAPGDRLPSTKALSEQLSVSLVTVHRALQELVASGVLRRGQGKGTFVHEDYLARARTSQGLRFGLVFHSECSLADFYHCHVLEGVRRGSQEIGADLVLLQFGEDWRKECHGFLYVNPMQDQLDKSPWFEAAATGSRRVRRPVVVVGASFDREHAHSIDTDNADIARQAFDHLTELGHRRIGYVGGSTEVANSVDRWRGFQAACTSRGLVFDDGHVLHAPGWRLDDAGRAALAAMLARPDRPTAIFAAGYYFALDVYAAANRAGLAIPRDISVVGVDDAPSAGHLSPGLTTLRQPLEQMGRLAASRLFHTLEAPGDQPRHTMLKAELIVRQSTAPPA